MSVVGGIERATKEESGRGCANRSFKFDRGRLALDAEMVRHAVLLADCLRMFGQTASSSDNPPLPVPTPSLPF